MSITHHKKPRPDHIKAQDIRILESFGEIIRARRYSLHLSQESLADYLGIAQSYLCELEKGNANPTIGMIFHICEKLGIKKPIFDDE